MIDHTKSSNALAAMNAVMIVIRRMANESFPYSVIEQALDTAEYLPRLMDDREDRTKEYRDSLESLVTLSEYFLFALERFDTEELGQW